MQFKMRAIAALAVLAVSGSANAVIDQFASSNSSLSFVATDAVGSPISLFVDLNYNLNDFLPTSGAAAAGTSISWNFSTNTITVNGVAQSSTGINWSAQYASFISTAKSDSAAGNIRWAVIAGDENDQRYLTTGNPTLDNINGLANAGNMSTAANLYAANANLGTHNGSVAGASTSASGQPFVGGINFPASGDWSGGITYSALSADKTSTKFQFIDALNGRDDDPSLARITTYGNPAVENAVATEKFSTFSFDSTTSTLTWVVPANDIPVVPEPATYGMLLGGLGLVGFMARRRKA